MVLPHKYLRLVLLLLSLLTKATSFNLDIADRQIFRGVDGSDFGFSVALHLNNYTGHKVIVGAPKDNTSSLLTQNITNGGAIYGCLAGDARSRCNLYEVDNRPNKRSSAEDGVEPQFFGTVTENRSNQRLGASVSTNYNGVIATCAPLYVAYGPRGTKREPSGDCWVSKDYGSRFIRTSPCTEQFIDFYKRAYPKPESDAGWASYHKTGHGMCGFSVALGPNNEMGIGAPGNYYFHGSLYSSTAYDDYQTFMYTRHGLVVDDNSYMSWDTQFGEFDGDPSTTDYVVSAPRANKLKGNILLWSRRPDKLLSLVNITGYQPGAYFGYALAVGNFKGSGYDDIVVGSPLFAEGNLPEVGQVHAFYQHRQATGNRIFLESDPLTGKYAYGRFGLSLANVGDVNLDGYDDLMVGAPYGGPDKRGVIYLYGGSSRGLAKQPMQVIYSEDISRSPPLQTFGWSIAGKMDVDQNEYVDVAVGAYKSNAAVLFKTRPIIEVLGSLTTSNNKIQLPIPCSVNYEDEITKDVIIDIEICVSYEAVNDPGEITLSGNLMFDSANNGTKRAFYVATGQSSASLIFPLQKGQRTCQPIQGYVQQNIRDRTSPLNISIVFELVGSRHYAGGSPSPVLNQLAAPTTPIQFEFYKSCDVCSPDLSIAVTTPTEHYTLGTDDKIDLTVRLNNYGEDSYQTTLHISLPDDVSYVNIVADESQCLPISCQQMYENETMNNYILCDVGNPYPAMHPSTFTIAMRLENIHKIDETELVFGFTINSNYADDLNFADNVYNLTIPLQVETSIVVTGSSNPADAILYNDTHIESGKGPVVEHKYEIYTNGPSVIQSAALTILWPLFSKDQNQYLLYLYKFPEIIQGDANCVIPARYMNPQNISVEGGQITSYNLDRSRYSTGSLTDSYTLCNNNQLRCIAIYCQLSNLRKEQSIIVKIHSLLWMSSSFKNLTSNYKKEAVITSTATANVLDVPYAIKPKTNSSASFTVTSYFEKFRPPKVLPTLEWKWIAVGIGCGLLLLIIIIIILWRCGFFKRYRPYAEAKIEKHKDGQAHEVERLYSSYN